MGLLNGSLEKPRCRIYTTMWGKNHDAGVGRGDWYMVGGDEGKTKERSGPNNNISVSVFEGCPWIEIGKDYDMGTK